MSGGISVGNSLDVSKVRWGLDVEPEWDRGTTVTNVTALQVLHSVKVDSGKVGYVFGFKISAEEPNVFYLRWVDDTTGATYKQIRIVFPSMGTVEFYDKVYIGKMYPTNLTYSAEILVVNAASDPTTKYEGSILWASV